MNKFRNKKIFTKDGKFDSKREMHRYLDPDPPQKNRRAARDSALSAPKTAPVLFGYKNISRGAARYPNALALPGVPLWNTSELFAPVCGLPGQTPRTPYITGHPIYKERK